MLALYLSVSERTVRSMLASSSSTLSSQGRSMADLSRVRNAARDVTRDMLRFERNFAPYQREVEAAAREGANERDITMATNPAVAGHPDLQRKLRELVEGMARA
jgi:hypothetical protein